MTPKKRTPRLRTVNKVKPPYPLNKFPNGFGFKLGKEIVYILATKGVPVIKGAEWEQIFANAIGADWAPSNVGLDDVTLGNCAWSAKSVKNRNPAKVQRIRLISGRNSPIYSFGETDFTAAADPDLLGEQVLAIWNARVSAIREKYKHLRTVVLIKSSDLLTVAVFEFETIRYDFELFSWQWNENNNLEGYDKTTGRHCFTWQPHGSQFTIIEEVPENCLLIKTKKPPQIDKDVLLKMIDFDKSWVTVTTR
ncbi:MAG TPA: hypothetical protein EYP90_15285 [Chromatiaceae bacterium]|nr:hypothetical protein [Chromatiaceae bacterium]HIP72746.1 hypothetical protein [Anaerolineae bacterium]